MAPRNPFLDLQAYGSDDEGPTLDMSSDGESVAGDDDEGEAQWKSWDDSGAMWEDEDAPVDDDPNRLTGPAFLDDMEKRYSPQNNLKSHSPVLVQSADDLLDKPTLHSELITKTLLTSERKRLFWQVKCKPGREIQIVFDIMNNFLPSVQLTPRECIDLFLSEPEGSVDDLEDLLMSILEVDSIPDSLRPSIDEAVAKKPQRFGHSALPTQTFHPKSQIHLASAPERAFQYLLSFAQSESTIPEAEEEVKNILQLDSLPSIWSTAIGAAVLEPGTDVDVVFQALNAMKSDLVPFSRETATPASLPPQNVLSNTVNSETPARSCSNDVYHLFSAFSIPDVSGSVYLEAYLGENPQNTPIIEYLRQHPAVIKLGNVRLDRRSNLHHQQVWLQPIHVSEVGELLSLSPPSIKPFSWVKITCGRYQNDVGLVIRRETSTARRRLAVLLVPRLSKEPPTPPSPPPHPNHPLVRAEKLTGRHESDQSNARKVLGKRKREHPLPQCLFARNEWPEGAGEGEWVQLNPNSYRMDRQEFQYDLLCSYLPYTSVTDIDVRMDATTRSFFGASQHPVLKSIRFPLPENWMFYHNELVEVSVPAPLTGQQRLDYTLPRSTYRKSGRIEQIESDRCLIHLDDYNDDVPQEYTMESYGVKNLNKKDVEDTDIWVNKTNLTKKISISDHVEAMAGNQQGRYGFVVSHWGQQITVVEMGSVQKEAFSVDINSCRIVQARNDVTVPWLNRHITIIRGQYRNHTGIVADVFPPSMNSFTTVDVRLPGWEQTICLRHDDIVETCTNKPLYQAFPLLPHQQGFQQASWSTVYAPTVVQPAFEGGRIVSAQEYLFRQQRPSEPWIDKLVAVIKGPIKNKGFVKGVELFHTFKSGMCVLIEFDYISAEHGANPRSYVDYSTIRDPDTGLPLHVHYPLSNRDRRYWRPLTIIPAISVPTLHVPPPRFQPLPPPSHTNTPMGPVLHTDPFHWSIDSRLDGKSFLAFYKLLDSFAKSEKEVIVTPNSTHGYVSCTRNRREHWRALPQEISLPADPARPIKAQYNTKPLLVV
ncbi:hypothetical protein VKT23_016243 [Stygiomarasmius scandens]|uniref:Uncharacterized protein n=1 Tax=Marasmiellus scandens TaxID=2682957 RepID=A0ABR1IVS0_9AGAR